jgi:hypothetical protein
MYSLTSVANILEVSYMVLISGLGGLLGWESWPLFDRFGCVEMTKFLMIKIMRSCRLSTDVPVSSVCGHLFSGRDLFTEVCARLEATARILLS